MLFSLSPKILGIDVGKSNLNTYASAWSFHLLLFPPLNIKSYNTLYLLNTKAKKHLQTVSLFISSRTFFSFLPLPFLLDLFFLFNFFFFLLHSLSVFAFVLSAFSRCYFSLVFASFFNAFIYLRFVLHFRFALLLLLAALLFG